MGSAGTDGMTGLFQVSLGDVKVAGEDGVRSGSLSKQSYQGGVAGARGGGMAAAAATAFDVGG